MGDTAALECCAQIRCGRRELQILLLVVRETEMCHGLGTFTVDLWRDGHKVSSHDNLFGFFNAFFEKRWRDRAFIYVEESDVVVGDLMKKDDELDEIGVRLLPERFFAFAEKIVEKRSDVEG